MRIMPKSFGKPFVRLSHLGKPLRSRTFCSEGLKSGETKYRTLLTTSLSMWAILVNLLVFPMKTPKNMGQVLTAWKEM